MIVIQSPLALIVFSPSDNTSIYVFGAIAINSTIETPDFISSTQFPNPREESDGRLRGYKKIMESVSQYNTRSGPIFNICE